MDTHLTKSHYFFPVLIPFLILFCAAETYSQEKEEYSLMLEASLRKTILEPWYPKAVDKEFGGFLSTFNFDFEPGEQQNKMIVTQARHIWTNAKAHERYPEVEYYLPSAKHGFEFLRDYMWDNEFGGFYQLVNRKGEIIAPESITKTAYGNSFAIYGLAAYYKASGDTQALELAKETFLWLEKAHDNSFKGYYQDLNRDGSPVERPENASINNTIGYKDYNSSIHILEALTELYQVWKDELLRTRLEEMLIMVRDYITNEKGYMGLYFKPDWKVVSLKDSTEEAITQRYRFLDHVSFGHDVETGFLLMEASHVLGLQNDTNTQEVAKNMIDHSILNGFDHVKGGFFDDGYYFKGEDTLRITRTGKNWWAQAEGLNALMLMHTYYPDDELQYFELFRKQWHYIDKYLIDHEHGGWYQGGIDEQPFFKQAQKGQIWKSTYHNYRALAHVVDMLRGEGL